MTSPSDFTSSSWGKVTASAFSLFSYDAVVRLSRFFKVWESKGISIIARDIHESEARTKIVNGQTTFQLPLSTRTIILGHRQYTKCRSVASARSCYIQRIEEDRSLLHSLCLEPRRQNRATEWNSCEIANSGPDIEQIDNAALLLDGLSTQCSPFALSLYCTRLL